MILVADIGNTNVCVALFEKSALLCSWRFESRRSRPADEWELLLRQALAQVGQTFESLEAFLVCAVVPDILEAFETLGRTKLGARFLVAGSERAPFANKAIIDHPGQEGADLMINAFCAASLYGGPCFVMDFGTATTLTKVDAKGNFCGVAIAPGVGLSANALFQAAAGLPRMSMARTDKIIGTNTADSIRAGLFWGYVSLAQGLITRALKETKSAKPLPVIATGGSGRIFANEIPQIQTYDADLTLKGLNLLYIHLCEKGHVQFNEELYQAV